MKIIRNTAYMLTPAGWLSVTGTESGIESVMFIHMMGDMRACCPGLNSFISVTAGSKALNDSSLPQTVKDCMVQLDEYFAGARKEFSVLLSPGGTDFRNKVWDEVKKVQYGSISTYSRIAADIGDKLSVRAVGNAIGRNPILIIIPCHRIIGSDGKLTGYAGGLERKKWLLDFEQNRQGLF